MCGCYRWDTKVSILANSESGPVLANTHSSVTQIRFASFTVLILHDPTCSSQVDPVPTHWKTTSNATKLLLGQFDCLPPEIEDAETSTDPDIRTDRRMRKCLDYSVYVKLSPLQPNTLLHSLEGTAVNWETKRGWFDELVKISKRRSANVGWRWTTTNGETRNEEDDELCNSYFELDLEELDNRQQERDHSLTLRPEQNGLLDQQI